MTDNDRAQAEHKASLGEEFSDTLASRYPELAERSRENKKLIEHWEKNGFDLPVDDPSAFYSDEYWSRKKFRPYPCVYPGGVVQVGEYHPPAPEWLGFYPLLEGMWEAVGEKPKTLLDVGCGCGSLVGHARRQGVDAYGVDVSKHAIDNPVKNAVGHVALADIRSPGAVREADVVTATDLMEHIHEPDVDGVIESLITLARQHLIMCICVCRIPSDEWMHVPGTPVPIEKAWIAVAGHVLLKPHSFWVDRFERVARGRMRVNWKAMHRFAQFMALHPALKPVESWCPANILMLTRD